MNTIKTLGEEYLTQLGLHEARAIAIDQALTKFHAELCRLDARATKAIAKNGGLAATIDGWAKVEGLLQIGKDTEPQG